MIEEKKVPAVKPEFSDSFSNRELEKVKKQCDALEEQIKSITLDRMRLTPSEETEQQTKISKREAARADAPYIRPTRSIQSKEQFNETFRNQHTRAWEYVKCIVENKELIGEKVEFWTKKFPGDAAHFWQVPVNIPVQIPRMCAERLAGCSYHRLKMEQTSQPLGDSNFSETTGKIVADTTVQRIDCRPVGFGF